MKMKLKIAYDNKAKPGFKEGWGFSCLIEMEDEKILFDTGWDGNILLSNMEKFGIRPAEIKRAIISHDHWDHAGGLPISLEKTYSCTYCELFQGGSRVNSLLALNSTK